MNLADPGEIDRAFDAFIERLERLDYLFNNAGVFLGQKALTDQTWEDAGPVVGEYLSLPLEERLFIYLTLNY